MYRQLRIVVVIPAYNEEEAIRGAVESVPSFVDEIIVVDDCSRDRTSERASQTKREAIVLRHATNRGVGASIVTGYREALVRKMDVAVVMAGDGQMDPDDLPALLDPIAEGRADYVKGNRFAHRELFTQMPPIRILGNTLLSLATKVTSGYAHLFDSQCGYTAITCATLRRLKLEAVFPRYGYPNDMLAHLHGACARVVDVPVRPIYGPTWRSGVRWHTAVYPVGFVLLKSWWQRRQSEMTAAQNAQTQFADTQSPPTDGPKKKRAAVQ
jgi:glycosyltransferase involved in cell wall biosynthesis